MDLSCPVCYVEDKDGEWYQCDKGHPVCADCYWIDIDHPRHNGRRPTCVLCRDVLKRGDPVACLERMQAIAAKKELIRAEVLRAEAEANTAEVVVAMAAADAKAAQDEMAEAIATAANIAAQEQRVAEQAAHKDAASALAWAQAAGAGDLDAHAAAEAEYKAKHEAKLKRQRDEEHVEKYIKKLRQHLASEPEAEHRASMSCMIIEGIFRDLSPSERVLVDAAIAQGAPVTAKAERRTDPNDGLEYTREEFISEYDGTREWDVAGMKVQELKAALKKRGLNQTGRKLELVERLLAADL